MGNLSNFERPSWSRKTKESGLPFCYRTILKQIVKSSLIEPSIDFVFESKSLTGVREDLKRFFSMPEQTVHVQVKIKHSSKNGRLHMTAVTNKWKKGPHEIIEILKKQARNVDDFKAKQSANLDSSQSNGGLFYRLFFFPTLKCRAPGTWSRSFFYQRFYFLPGMAETKVHVNAMSLAQEGGSET